MARKPRFALPGIPQHVIQRGHNREPWFYAEDDYSRYLGGLKEAFRRNDCRLHAYVLMTNHVHLLLTPMSEFQGQTAISANIRSCAVNDALINLPDQIITPHARF